MTTPLRIRLKTAALALLLIGLTLTTSHPALAQNACAAKYERKGSAAQAVETLTAYDAIKKLVGNNRLLVPEGAPNRMGSHIMFGFESEYAPSEAVKILKFYAPKNMPVADWLKLSDQERVDWLANAAKNKGLGNKNSGLVKINTTKRFDFLPQYPIIDDTGNLELIIGPIDRFQTWLSQVQTINETFGTGSQQAMTSIPKQFLFKPQGNHEEDLTQVLGMYNFLHQYDTLSRMNDGAQRFDPAQGKFVLKTFAHPYVGPISRAKQLYMTQILTQMANQKKVAFNSLTAQSSKYIGSTTPRPDIGANMGRIGSEVRDAHNNEPKLIEKASRISLFLMGNREPLKPFSEVVAVDTKEDFAKFPDSVQAMLKKLYPTPLDQTFGAAAEVFALEVFRNFAYPLKDWTGDLRALGRPDLTAKVERAKAAYLRKIKAVAEQFQAGTITEPMASSLVQGACAQFSKESGLYAAYNQAYVRIVSSMTNEILAANQQLAQVGPQ
jgi:hypothetical protein